MLTVAIFLVVIMVIGAIYRLRYIKLYIKKYAQEDAIATVFGLSVAGGVFLLAIVGVSIYKATMIYPALLAKKATAISLKSEIIRIKKSYYPQKSSGKFIGGSLDNMKQSTALSLYIAKYAKAKAKFNASLAKNKAICSMPIYWIFGSNIVMDCNAITNMKNL